jgi:hypothetical protein
MPESVPRTGDRRPIAAREWAVSQRLADWLAGRGVRPNTISTAGMFVFEEMSDDPKIVYSVSASPVPPKRSKRG